MKNWLSMLSMYQTRTVNTTMTTIATRIPYFSKNVGTFVFSDSIRPLFFAPPSLELQLARAARMHVRGLMPPPPRLSMPLMGSVHGCAGAVAQVRSHTRSTRVP